MRTGRYCVFNIHRVWVELMAKRALWAGLVLLSGCGFLEELGLPKKEEPKQVINKPVVEPTAKYRLALGGVAPGRDELVIVDASGNPKDFGSSTLEFTADPSIVEFVPTDGKNSFAEGSGAKLIPKRSGVATVKVRLDGLEQKEVFQVSIPPQKLIQILIGEAKGQLITEATVTNGAVVLTSRSITAEALAHVVKNRIAWIEAKDQPSLFNADAKLYSTNPPQSWYDAVIEAKGQFKPVETGDPSHDIYLAAEKRSHLSGQDLVAYDQALQAAADAFAGNVSDPTNAAFAFRSPNSDQWFKIKEALASGTKTLPDGIGVSDSTFPTLAPVQVLVHPRVLKYSDGRSTFIFTRSRDPNEVAVTDQL